MSNMASWLVPCARHCRQIRWTHRSVVGRRDDWVAGRPAAALRQRPLAGLW